MESSKKPSDQLTKRDGDEIKNAILNYLATSPRSDTKFIKKELLESEPRIDIGGMLRIGEWVYNAENKTLRKYLTPGRPAGYDYVIKLQHKKDKWRVLGLHRVEVFQTFPPR